MGEHLDPTIVAIPLFIVTLVGEAILVRHLRRRGRADLVGYEARDTFASLAMGVGSIFTSLLVNAAELWLATRLWPHRAWDLGTGALGWAVAMIGWDFLYYWEHRAGHENRLLWAAHVNHHSSERYNLSTALRQAWTEWTALVFYPGLALVGVRPWMILTSHGLNLVYQYWIHTEAVGKMPRWFEAVFNTPSHHRVHHGSNPRYLDRNYGGILIVWDRLFGTFEPEGERVRYGLTKNIGTFHPVRIAFHEYLAIGRDLVAARGLRAKLGILWHGPAWRPELDP